MRAVQAALLGLAGAARADLFPAAPGIDAEVSSLLAHTHGHGLALAAIDGGRVSFVRAYGIRDAAGHPLTDDTVMYGASLT